MVSNGTPSILGWQFVVGATFYPCMKSIAFNFKLFTQKKGHEPPTYGTSDVPHSRFLLVVPFVWDLQYFSVDLKTQIATRPTANSNDPEITTIRERSDISHQMEKETDLPNYLWMGYDSFWGCRRLLRFLRHGMSKLNSAEEII